MSLKHLCLGNARRVTVALAGLALLVSASWVLLHMSVFPSSERALSRPILVASDLRKLPLHFESNRGQTDSTVKYMARGAGYGIFLTQTEAVLKLADAKTGAPSVLSMQLLGSNPASRITGTDMLPGKSNYLIGKNPKNWRTGIDQFSRVGYESVYPGIDLIYYGNEGRLEYDFRVAPGADPKQIGIKFKGARAVQVSERVVELQTSSGSVQLEAPRVYQLDGKLERTVEGHFVRRGENEIGFNVPDYDRSRTLVIDPVLSYSTYLGGSGDEFGTKIAIDSGLNFYVAGTTTSANFPGTSVAGRPDGASDAFVAKFDPTGSTLIFATYLGGNNTETVAGIGVDGGFNVYVGGTTASSDFPTSANAFQAAPKAAGSHVFVTQLNSSGSGLLYSTYLSGSGNDIASGLAIDNRGNAYVTGTTTSSTDFPVTSGTFPWPPANPTIQFFVSKVSTTGSGASSLPYSSYFGGGNPATGEAVGGGIAVDTSGNIYITGGTTFKHIGTTTTPDANDFPILNAVQSCIDTPPPLTPPTTAPTCDNTLSNRDAFVAKITPPTGSTGPQLVYSTYLGGSLEDTGLAIAVDTANNAYITGSTNSGDLSTSIPTSPVAYQKTLGGGFDAFVAKIGATQNTTTHIYPLNYFSFLGGGADETGFAIAADSIQGVRVTGSTASANFPTLNPIQAAFGGGATDAFVARIDTTASTTTNTGQWATYLGGSGADGGTGIAVDANNQTYVTGQTQSANFPKANPFQGSLSGPSDAFVTKIGAVSTLTVTGAPTPTTVGVGNTLTFKYTIKNTGPDPAFNVTLTDVVPSTGATFSSATASPGSCTAPTGTPAAVTCAIGALAVNATATVSIVVTPTAAAPTGIGNSATVTFNNGSTVTATASPTPVVTDFRVDVSPSTATVVAGQTATYTITVTPLPTYSGSVALSCSSGLPSGAACTITSSPVTLPNTSPVTAQLAISTTARPINTAQSSFTGLIYALWLPIGGIALLGRGTRRRWLTLLGIMMLAALIALQFGCGSSGKTPPVTGGTPAGTYTITVSASSGSASRTSPLTLVVQ